MKKIINACLLTCFALLIMGCSSDIDSNGSGSTISVNPPDWIIGSWVVTDANTNESLQFTDSNFYFGDATFTASVCSNFKEVFMNEGITFTNYEETFSDTLYEFSYTANVDIDKDGFIDLTYIAKSSFVKISSTTMQEKDFSNGQLAQTANYVSSNLAFPTDITE